MPKLKQSRTTVRGKEKAIIQALKDITNSDMENYYILFLYAPELIPCEAEIKTYKDLVDNYPSYFKDLPEKRLQKILLKESVQEGISYLLKHLDKKRDTDLLNKYYDLAMSGDVQALKAYMEFKKEYFKDGETDELKAILKNANIKETDADYNFDDYKIN